MGKGSGRRKENTKLVEANWDKIFNKKKNHINKKYNYNIVFDNQEQKEKWLWFLECLEERYANWEKKNLDTVGKKIIEHLENPFFSIGENYDDDDDDDDGYGNLMEKDNGKD